MSKFFLFLPAFLLPHLTIANPYYSRADGLWSQTDTWSLSLDGPPAFETPSSSDTVYIRHSVIYDAGSTYKHTGNIIIESNAYLHFNTGYGSSNVFKFEGERFEVFGTLTTTSDFFHQASWSSEYGVLILNEGSGFAIGDDLILCGTGETILNTINCGDAGSLDDIYFIGTQSKLCGQGHFIIPDRMRAWDDDRNEITPASAQIVNQICAGFQLFDDPGTCSNPVITGGGTFVLKQRDFDLSTNIKGQQIQLSWLADREEKGARYFIERSSDGQSFRTLKHKGPKKAPQNQMHAYDRFPPTGTLYYRVKQLNQNGQETFSETVSLHFQGANLKLAVSNKSGERDCLQLSGFSHSQNLALRVFNTNGSLVQKTHLAPTQSGGSAELFLPPDLPSGVYVIELLHPSTTLQARFILP